MLSHNIVMINSMTSQSHTLKVNVKGLTHVLTSVFYKGAHHVKINHFNKAGSLPLNRT